MKLHPIRLAQFAVLLLALLAAPAATLADDIYAYAGCPSINVGAVAACDLTITDTTGLINHESAAAVVSLSSGTMGAKANASFTRPSGIVGDTSYSATAEAGVLYGFTISGGPSSGTLVISGSVVGTDTADFSGCAGVGCGFYSYAYAQIDISSFSNEESILGNGGNLSLVAPSGVSTSFQIARKFSSSAPVGLGFFLDTSARCMGSYDGTQTTVCSETANFFDTASITGAQVFDDSGNLVQGATVISDSGFNPNAPQPVPEPGTMVLLGTGLLGLGGTVKRKFFT